MGPTALHGMKTIRFRKSKSMNFLRLLEVITGTYNPHYLAWPWIFLWGKTETEGNLRGIVEISMFIGERLQIKCIPST